MASESRPILVHEQGGRFVVSSVVGQVVGESGNGLGTQIKRPSLIGLGAEHLACAQILTDPLGSERLNRLDRAPIESSNLCGTKSGIEHQQRERLGAPVRNAANELLKVIGIDQFVTTSVALETVHGKAFYILGDLRG